MSSPDNGVYLDHAASSAVRPRVREVLDECLRSGPGNASSSHAAGRRVRTQVEEARERIAAALGARPGEIVFTSGGTEADNLAVKGLTRARLADGARHLVVSAVEHDAVLASARWLAAHEGVGLSVVPPEPDGRVAADRVLQAVRDDTAVVSVMAANNVLGAVNDIAALGRRLAEREVALHTDAVQAFATQPVDVQAWNVDALSLSAHKFGGPQGVGVAYLRRGVPVEAITHGGGQDQGVRSGTFAAALDAACGVAVEEAVVARPALAERLRELSERLADGLLEVDGIVRNGPVDPDHRLPSHVHVAVDGVDGEALVFALDQRGVMVSAGSACHAGAAAPDHVLEATGIEADAAVRLSLGWTTTAEDVDRAVEIIKEVVTGLRDDAAGGFLLREVG